MSFQPNSLIKTTPISFSNAGDNIIVTAVPGQLIEVWQLYFVVNGATNITFKDGSNNALSGALPMLANGALTFDYTGLLWFTTTSASNNFIINSSSAVQISGQIYYTQS